MDTTAGRKARIAALKGLVDGRLAELAPTGPSPLCSAMRQALTSPGKRLRPILALITAVQLGQAVEAALDPACAVEMVHAASLVLDDLPCMDDAALRRGQPSIHARFGEDVAVLTGVALLNQAYGVIARSEAIPAAERLGMVEALAEAVGMEGLCAGQALDLGGPAAGLAELRDAHHRKTGVLFMAAVTLGALAGSARVSERLALERFAAELGLAFQARDDIADAADAEGQSLIRLLGRDGANQEADRRLSAARQALVEGGVRLEPLTAYIDLLLPQRQTEPTS